MTFLLTVCASSRSPRRDVAAVPPLRVSRRRGGSSFPYLCHDASMGALILLRRSLSSNGRPSRILTILLNGKMPGPATLFTRSSGIQENRVPGHADPFFARAHQIPVDIQPGVLFTWFSHC